MSRIALLAPSLFLCWGLCAPAALAAPTALVLNPENVGDPYVAEFSQGVTVRALLVTTAGDPVVGERVNLKLRLGDDADTEFLFADPVTDAQGVATGRLTLVNGRYGGETFPARAPEGDVPGERYVITATFLGDGGALGCDGLDAGPPAGDAGADGTLCDAETTAELFVQPEVSTLVLAPGNEVQLGETLRLFATLTDENGNAPEAGTATDGDTPVPLSGRSVSFFYDVDGNGSPALNERIQCENTGETTATTNGQGIAACDFLADPSYVDTINVENGIMAQFGGDDFYSVAGASQSLTVSPGPPEASRTILSVDPELVPADGFSIVTVDASLVDAANNVLTIDDPIYDVSFETSIGTLEGPAERDVISGHYLQQIQATREAGRATVQVIVEGVPGAEIRVEFTEAGCSCDETGGAGRVATLLSSLALLGLLSRTGRSRRLRRRRS